MFTGIIEEVGSVLRAEPLGGGLRLTVGAGLSGALRADESISVNGACQTVVRSTPQAFEVIAIEETLRKTNLGALREGSRVNLERSMQAGARLDGHIVQGHVDCVGVINGVQPEGAGTLFGIRFDQAFEAYLIPVGSVAVDGISLTVARLEREELTVAIIPHTLEKTAISLNWRVGAAVNLEFDLLGKYVVRWLEQRGDAADTAEKSIRPTPFLRPHGL